ncbi:3-methylmercaptopropionyl-CoA ligase of DmdB2 type [hydrothermal vent metagenome]|uniref:3-methylmercaptopropionyl-CoA ligase of DmdB2 type n=1 Tax=hydrothermal vent metagenome TaxID=652676 RepID=A0A3B0R5R5_9ZZZZ
MQGMMQDWQLTTDRILRHAKINHPHRQVVSRQVDGSITRTSYGEIYDRARLLSSALLKRGIKLGDRVGTMAWNNARHMETWYAIMGIGAVCHTLNPRLHPDQLKYIVNHAGDVMFFVDLSFVPLLEAVQDELSSITTFVVLCDAGQMPKTSLRNVLCFEELLAEGEDDVVWGDFDENTACGLCYTSGTTGNPKGVLYSHRSNTLMAMTAALPDMINVNGGDTCLMVVPMFHANAWALTFTAPMTGMNLVMPGPMMDGESIYELLDGEKCTVSAAVPTVWLMLLNYLKETGNKLPYLNEVVIGGSACPRAIMESFDKDFGVKVIHAWGMTETSPLGTISRIEPEIAHLPYEEQLSYRLMQGRNPFIIEMRTVDEQHNELPRDGKTSGRLLVRGPIVSKAYFGGDGGSILDADGWFDTGDVATIDALGYMQITDRSKDVIKSGGEWISSIDLENAAIGHPAAAECAVIGLPHPKWDERPLLIVQLNPGMEATADSFREYLTGKIAKWWMPDDIVFVDEIPHGPTGKISKLDLRKTFKDFVLSTV